MNPIKILSVLFILISLTSCAPKKVIKDIPLGTTPEDKLFSRAEKQFDKKMYDRALEHYSDYLALYPNTPLAPAALLKIGAIYSAKEEYEKARESYNRIISEYPESYFVPDSKIEILSTYYNEGSYEDVISHAEAIPDDTISNTFIIRKYALIGDAYMALGLFSDAAYSFIKAYNKTQDPERKSIFQKLDEVVAQMFSSDILSLLNRPDEMMPREYLMYHLGLSQVREEKYEEAISTLTEFMVRFPNNEDVQNAKNLIEELNGKSKYNHNAIGILLPLSGRYEAFGNRALRGIELALEQFDSLGLNSSIELYVEDTNADSKTAVQGFQALAQNDVAAIIGPIITAESAAKQAQESGIPLIALTQKEQIPEVGDYIFRNFLTPKMQVKTLITYAVESLGLSKFAILYPDENYGNTFMNLFWDEVIARNGEIVGVESYDSSHTDFAAPIKKLVGLYYDVPEELKNRETKLINETDDPTGDFFLDLEIEDTETDPEDDEPKAIVDFDAVFIPDGAKKAGLIIPQLVYYDVKDVYLFGTNLWHSNLLIDLARQHIQGAIIPEIFFSDSASQEVKQFVSLFENTFGESPGFIEALSYDTAMMLFEIISRPDIRFRSSIKENLKGMTDYRGITGLTSFDMNGEVQKKLYLLQVSGNGFIEIEHN